MFNFLSLRPVSLDILTANSHFNVEKRILFNNTTPISWPLITLFMVFHPVMYGYFFLQVHINQEPFDCTVAFISLPPSLRPSFPSGRGIQPRVQFHFFGTPALFQVPQSKHPSEVIYQNKKSVKINTKTLPYGG